MYPFTVHYLTSTVTAYFASYSHPLPPPPLSPCGSEKANFALTLTDKNGLLVAQASLYDYPNVEGVDQAAWEKWLPEMFDLPGAVVSLHVPQSFLEPLIYVDVLYSMLLWVCWTLLLQPLNTLFLHFFAARDELCLAAMNEILRITFTALPQLQYLCLAVPRNAKLGASMGTALPHQP